VTRIGLIIAMFGLLGFSASATNELVLQRDYSAQPRQLIVCSFDPSVLAHGFSDKQLDEVDWAGYLKRNITITELSRFRSATHVPTAMGPITTMLPLSGVDRERSAREYGCPTNENSIILFGKDGTEKTRWSAHVSNDDLFDFVDALPVKASLNLPQTTSRG